MAALSVTMSTAAGVAKKIASGANFILAAINENEKLVYNISRARDTLKWSSECAEYLASKIIDEMNEKDKLFHTAIISLLESIERLQLLLEKLSVKNDTLMKKAVSFFTAKDRNERLDRYFNDIDNCLLRLKYQHQIVREQDKVDAGKVLKNGPASEFWNTNFGSNNIEVKWEVFLLAMENRFEQPYRVLEEEMKFFFQIPKGSSTNLNFSHLQLANGLKWFGPFEDFDKSFKNILTLNCFSGLLSREEAEADLKKRANMRISVDGIAKAENAGLYILRFSAENSCLVISRIDPLLEKLGGVYNIQHRKIRIHEATKRFYTKLDPRSKWPVTSFESVHALLINDKKLQLGCKIPRKEIQRFINHEEDKLAGKSDSLYGGEEGY
jgi:hypothetical protein